MLAALHKELQLRKNELGDEQIETIYFGGGTPSILAVKELQDLIDSVYEHYDVIDDPEVTLEANPDDLSEEQLYLLKTTSVNRLSIGVQSFFEEDLQLMNRAHNAKEAVQCIEIASELFDNITIDLIYGIPGMTMESWAQNIEKALSFRIPHISSYALTVEPKTALEHMIAKGKVAPVDDDLAQEHFLFLVDKLQQEGFVHYELSNFGKEGFFSQNNTAYWLGKKYLGIGPSAHSFNGARRSWNVRNNTQYIKALLGNELPSEIETLSVTDRYNEAVMTGLRTIWGVSVEQLERDFGPSYKKYFLQQIQKYLEQELLYIDQDIVRATKKGKFLTDGIASDLFMLNLS